MDPGEEDSLISHPLLSEEDENQDGAYEREGEESVKEEFDNYGKDSPLFVNVGKKQVSTVSAQKEGLDH